MCMRAQPHTHTDTHRADSLMEIYGKKKMTPLRYLRTQLFQNTKTCPATAAVVFFQKLDLLPSSLPQRVEKRKQQSAKDIRAPVFSSYLSQLPVITAHGGERKKTGRKRGNEKGG